jgi:sterol desaturase/sphingolipid hydroxylase (fatty acid hydroxylase superfamily)
MRPEYVSIIIIVSWALMLTALERIIPYQVGYPMFRKGYWMDFFWYTLVQSYFLGVLIAFFIRWINRDGSVSGLHLITAWPLVLQVLFFVISHDIWQYWFHRIQHNNKYWWRTHEAAHATPEVDWLVGSRSHALEILVAQTVEFAPIVLLGARPEVALIKGTLDAVWGMYNHANIRVDHGKLIYFFNGPQLHRWHHNNNNPGTGVNFSTKLSVWDWIWKTAYLPKPDERPAYGFKGIDKYPVYSYFRQFAYAFRKFKKRADNINSRV